MSTTFDYTVDGGYIELDITTNPATIQSDAMATIAAALPGWIPRESQPEVLLLEQFAAMCAETANVAAVVPLAIFSYFGALVGIIPETGAAAVADTTWTLTNSLSYDYIVPAGTQVGYPVQGNQLYVFQTAEAFTIPSGQTQATMVPIQSTVVGSAYNSLPAQPLTLVTSLALITSVASTTTSAGGADVETTTAYLNRLSNELQLLTPRPILPNDFAQLAASVPGVYRAAAFNLLDPFANLLSAADATFVGSEGSWTAVSGCSISLATGPSGEDCLEITASGSGAAVVKTGMYPMSSAVIGHALCALDYVSTARACTLSVLCYDVNNNPIGSPISSVATNDSTSLITWLMDPFTTPTGTVNVELELSIASPASSEPHYLAFPSLMIHQGYPHPVNFVFDSGFEEVSTALTWSLTSGLSVNTAFDTNDNSVLYTGTGGASGVLTAYSGAFYLPAGTYSISGYIDATAVTSGNPKLEIKYGGTPYGAINQTGGVAGVVEGTVTLGSPEIVQFVFSTANCYVTSGETLQFAYPQLLTGSTYAPYTDGPSWGPPDQVYNNERTVTVCAVDVDGNALDPITEAAVASYLEAEREVNFIVYVVGPTYTPISVTWSGVANQDASAATVQAAGDAALTAYLSPANWAGGNASPPYWDPTQNIVRYLTIVTLLGDTPGLDYLTGVTLGYQGATLTADDVDLIGFAPLPTVGNINGSVTPFL